MRPYEKSLIWQRSFGPEQIADDMTARLASEYASAWDKACNLAKRIASDAPGLTLHDEKHFARLWECADMIVGPDYELSPIETFVFGVAILIHDAAHTVLAYEGGLESLQQTDEWRDAVALATENYDGLDSPDVTELHGPLFRAVLFDTLRALHAKQAEVMLSRSFRHPRLQTEHFLVQDPTIRDHFGRLIGKVAASHHWNVAELARLGRQHNPVPPYDKFGPIRPMVLGALMRTADAIQIDAARAPDFEFALTQPKGVSQNHWTAQNTLAIARDMEDQSSVLVTNSQPFIEDEASAWWIAFDLALTADRELRASDQILRDSGLPPFAVNRVKDVGDPQRFAEHVTTDGWNPVRAEVKVTDTAKIVTMFGGTGLYGNDKSVPLRELIQNAVDAVRARRLLETGYEGKISVSLKSGTNRKGEDGHWLNVSDDGIGMSPTILTGPFLTFGESGWSSAVLRAERVGFAGKRFRHIGRFGIGFFSAFMIASEISVTSRPFDKAASDAKSLNFREGLALRPLMKPAAGSMSVSTSIDLFLTNEIKEEMLQKSETARSRVGGKTAHKPAEAFSLSSLLDMICPAIDVLITVKEDASASRLIGPDWTLEEPVSWLTRANGVGENSIPDIVATNSKFIDVIKLADGRVVGRACLNPTNTRLSIFTVGGFAEKRLGHVEHGGRHHVGCLDTSPEGPRRNHGEFPSSEAIAEWADRQVALWSGVQMTDQERNFISANAAHFGGDPSPIANCVIDGRWFSVADVFDRLSTGAKITAPVRALDADGERWSIAGRVNRQSGSIFFQEDVVVTLPNVLVAGATGDIERYWLIPDDNQERQPNSFIGCLGRYSLERGMVLCMEADQVQFGHYAGETSKREYMTHGEPLIFEALILSLEPC